MTTAVDSNVLFDILLADPEFGTTSEHALRRCFRQGRVLICPVVYAELATAMAAGDVDRFLGDLVIGLDPFRVVSLRAAGEAWRAYRDRRGSDVQCPACGGRFPVTCPQCGRALAWRQHMIADFLIGAHAMRQADQLLTSDPGYYRTYFPDLALVPLEVDAP